MDGIVNRQSMADECRHLLRDEETQMRRIRDELLAIRQALVSADAPALEHLVEEHAGVLLRLSGLNERRDRFRRQLAESLGVALEDATVRRLLGALDPASAAALDRQRRDVEGLATEIERLLLSTVALIRHSIDLFGRLMEALTGEGQRAPRYSQAGATSRATCGAILQTRC